MRSSPAPAGARRAICRWWRSRRPRSSGWRATYPQIEDILPLSPLQEGLLFHALYDAQAPDVYTVQLELGLAGPLDSEALQAAARALVQRHASLRASFRHENLSRPVQIIVPRVTVPWRRIDLSLLDDASQAERLARILAEERAERFDLGLAAAASLCADPARARPASAGAHQSSHPDGRLVDAGPGAGAAHALCAAAATSGMLAMPLPRVTPYRDYLAWIAAQDRDAAIAAWREALAGLDEATRVAPHGCRDGAPVGARADHAGAERDADRGADPAGARAGPDAQHRDPGGVGDPAGAADRARRRGVRGDGGGTAAGDCRHRAHGGAVHQHAAAARQAAAGPAAAGDCSGRCRRASRA